MKNASLARSCIRSPKKKTRTVLKENKDFFDGPGEPAIMPKRNAKVNIHNFIFPFWAVHIPRGQTFGNVDPPGLTASWSNVVTWLTTYVIIP